MRKRQPRPQKQQRKTASPPTDEEKRAKRMRYKWQAVRAVLTTMLGGLSVGIGIVGYFVGLYTEPVNEQRLELALYLAISAGIAAVVLAFLSEPEE